MQQVPVTLRPALALEARAIPSWYINLLATYPEARGQGAATALLMRAQDRAIEATATRLSLIVTDINPARRLYDGFGFQEVAREPRAGENGGQSFAHWILMTKETL